MNFKIIHSVPGSWESRRWTEGRKAFACALVLLVGAGVAARVLALPRLLPDLDAVNFARALDRFELSAQAPHFPGYPVYVALARLAAEVGAPEVVALALPGLVLGAVAIAVLALVLRPLLGPVGALVGAALVALLPLPVLFGATPGSDGVGLALLVLAACAVLRTEDISPGVAVTAGLVAGVALGARPSFLPALLGLALVVPRGRRRAAFAGACVGVAAWLLPMVALTGPAELVRIGSGFLLGHAGEWGGTIAVRPDLGWRLEHFGFNVLAAGLGLPWFGTSAGDSGLLLASRLLLSVGLGGSLVALAGAVLSGSLFTGEKRVALLALALGVPYGAWMFLGQNLLKARHALPVVLMLALLVAVGVSVLARALRESVLFPVAGMLAVVAAGVMLPVALAQGSEPSPAALLVKHVASTLPPSNTLLFTGEEARLFEHYAPHYRAGRPATAEQLRREVARVAAAGARVYVTSTSPGVESLAPHLEPVSRFTCDRRVRSHAHEIVLFHYRTEPPDSSEKVL